VGAGIANYYRVDKQIKRFEDIYQYLCKNELKPEIRHSACSAASIMFPATRMDMVRVGIIQYGLWPSPEVFVNFLSTKRVKLILFKELLLGKAKS
jgi:alanine racemase